MTRFFNRYATPLTAGLFLVSLISGVALFFHTGPAGMHPMHEWLSMVLIVPFVLHIWKNWRPMTVYLRHAPMAIALSLSALAGAWFLWSADASPGGAGGGNPAIAVLTRVTSATPAQLAPVFDTTAQAMTEALRAEGIAVAGPDEPLTGPIAASGKSAMQVAQALGRIGR